MAASRESDGISGPTDNLYADDVQQPLQEFICTHSLPEPVSVTQGNFISPCVEIRRGDVLLLRSKAPITVSLSFTDTDSGEQRQFNVSPDIPYKFLVLPPKENDNTGQPDNARPVSMVTYPTVTDLLMDCPTYFQANCTYDDPYLPGFSVTPGDRFRFVKVTRDAKSKTERLQCRTESNELVCLSTKCKGNFTVITDDTAYTLRNLIDLADVPRRLKLAAENKVLNVCESASERTKGASDLPEIPLCFTGVITMSRPKKQIHVSPLDSPDITWAIPLDANLHVKPYAASDYEEPVTSRKIKPQPLATFVSEHGQKFPVHATLFAYTNPPEGIAQCLRNIKDIIVHKTVQSQKLFVKDSKKDEYFAIDQSVNIGFVEIPRTLSSIFEMMALPLGSQVQVLTDVAADFPEPFILRYGDVLRVTKHDSSSWKLKRGSTIRDVPVVKCERVVQGGKPEKLKLPLDLEVSLVVLIKASQLKVTKLADIFTGKEGIPSGYVSVLEGTGGSYPPLPASLEILQVLTEKELLISPLPLGDTTAVSPRISTSVKIPLRHQVLLGFKRKLEFPDGYFIMPPKEEDISVNIEPVSENTYEETVQAKKIATDYEDVEFSSARSHEEDARSQASSSGRGRCSVNSESEYLPRSSSSGALERKHHKDRVKQMGRALNPKNWRLSRAAPVSEEEQVPVPVSGILTLSLQPSRAASNTYTGGIGEGLECLEPAHPQEDDTEVDPYEDVSFTPGQLQGAKSESLRSDPAMHQTAVQESAKRLSASNNDVNRLGKELDSRSMQQLLDTIKSLPEQLQRKHKRGKSDVTSKRRSEMSRDAELSTRRERRNERKDSELFEDDLERAPAVQFTRTISAEEFLTQETTRKSRSHDKASKTHSSEATDTSLTKKALSRFENFRKSHLQIKDPRKKEQSSEGDSGISDLQKDSHLADCRTESISTPPRKRNTKWSDTPDRERIESPPNSQSFDGQSEYLQNTWQQQSHFSESHCKQQVEQSPDGCDNPHFQSSASCPLFSSESSSKSHDNKGQVRPVRPGRKIDANSKQSENIFKLDDNNKQSENVSKEVLGELNIGTSKTLSTFESSFGIQIKSEEVKAIREKPPIPRKPVVSPRAGIKHPSETIAGVPRPVAPPRKRGARTGAVEAEV